MEYNILLILIQQINIKCQYHYKNKKAENYYGFTSFKKSYPQFLHTLLTTFYISINLLNFLFFYIDYKVESLILYAWNTTLRLARFTQSVHNFFS